MPVDSQHPEYSKKITRWQKNLDAFHGEDAVKNAGKTYLTAPGGFDEGDYVRYKTRAKWFGATAQTVKGLRGAVFQKDPDKKVSTSVEKHLENITLTGIPIEVLAGVMFGHLELIGRYGILLDYNEKEGRPFWSGYPASNIINWRTQNIDGKVSTVMVVLKEHTYSHKDMFEVEAVIKYRVCYLNDDGDYQIDVYENRPSVGGIGIYKLDSESIIPVKRGNPLDFVPFQIFGAEDLTFDISDGPLDSLVDVNYAYYRHSADYEHGLFLTGLPTPVITGQSIEEGKPLVIGSLAAWVLTNPEAKAYLLEYQGHGLQSHEKAMDNDKQEMATLGARLLEEMPETQETLGAVQIRHSGETGSLKSLANLASSGLSQIIRWHHWWNGDTENVEDERYLYWLNTDFSTARLDPQEMQALIGLWQSGGISKQTLFWNLYQGEVVPAERTFEEEELLIEQQPPARLPFGEEPDDEPDDDEEGEGDEEETEDAA